MGIRRESQLIGMYPATGIVNMMCSCGYIQYLGFYQIQDKLNSTKEETQNFFFQMIKMYVCSTDIEIKDNLCLSVTPYRQKHYRIIENEYELERHFFLCKNICLIYFECFRSFDSVVNQVHENVDHAVFPHTHLKYTVFYA